MHCVAVAAGSARHGQSPGARPPAHRHLPLCPALALLPQVFVTAQARCLDLATAYVQGAGVLLAVSPGLKQALLQRLDKYVFPGDKVGGSGAGRRGPWRVEGTRAGTCGSAG